MLLARSCQAGLGTAWGEPVHRTSWRWGFGDRRGAGSQLHVLAHAGSRAAPLEPAGNSCGLEELQDIHQALPAAATFGLKLEANSQRGGKTCHPLYPTKVRLAPPQRTQGFSSGKPDSDFSSSRQTHRFLPAFSDQILGTSHPEPRVTGFHRKQKVRQVTRAHPTSSRDCTRRNLACLQYARRSRRKLQFVNRRWERLLRDGDNISETLMLIALRSAADFNSK